MPDPSRPSRSGSLEPSLPPRESSIPGVPEGVWRQDPEAAVEKAAERLFQSGVLGEIAAAAWDHKPLDDRDEMKDCVVIARLVLGLEVEAADA